MVSDIRMAIDRGNGSVLGPILFSLYVAEIEQLVARHAFHSHQYADDMQIYEFCEPHNTPHLALRMAECFSDVASWTSSNQLRLNGDKTEAIWFHPASPSMPTPPVQLSGVTITPSCQNEMRRSLMHGTYEAHI